MRTTVTLDPDVESQIRRVMQDRGVGFKQALNDAVRAGATARSSRRAPLPTYPMGAPLVDITKALRLAGELEDQELVSRLIRGA